GIVLCVIAARATGKVILDGVYNDIKDPDGFAAEFLQGRQMCFDGKTLIHPRQIEAANTSFAPDAAEVVWSKRIIEAFESASREGKGVVLVDGKLVENLHVAEARRQVALAEAIAAMDGAGA
ncbi:MAG: CoA ester lyase, partial [Geminicoccaceae bacterium]|nr:CoA ester lyase [Geminicoccaceae bacterium]